MRHYFGEGFSLTHHRLGVLAVARIHPNIIQTSHEIQGMVRQFRGRHLQFLQVSVTPRNL
jgi:hypothetical protein